jgi:hypothetical protein
VIQSNIRFGYFMLLMTCSSSLIGQPGDRAGGRLATVTIHLTTTSGDKQLGGELSVYSRDGARVYSTTTASEVSISLPYGEYAVTFTSEFLRPVRRPVKVDRPDCFVVLATSMGPEVLDIPIKAVSVSLKVTPSESCTPGGSMWAKLVGVYADYATEQRISSRGYALFEPLEMGTYLAVIVDGKQVRATQPIVTWGPITVVNLSLPACENQAK